ncbi:MAG: GAF domain-containing protein [Ideonella sp.]
MAPPDSVFNLAIEQQMIARAMRKGASASPATAMPGQVMQSYCDALTTLAPRIALAWIWFGEPDAQLIKPQIYSGRAREYAQHVKIERNWLTAKGPVFRAIDGRRSVIFSISPWSVWKPWRQVAREHHICSVIALQLVSNTDQRRGLLVLYSDTEQYFDFLGEQVFRSMADLFSVVLSKEARPG